jgi:23S rRNA (pseudouridine1915-N3)-methyltransferase
LAKTNKSTNGDPSLVSRIRIVVVGQTKLPFILEGQQFYLDRLRHYTTVRWSELKSVPAKRKTPEKSVKGQEGVSILRNIDDREYVMALDRKGKMYDSRGLASHLEKTFMNHDRLVFVIGGVLGLSEDVLKRAHAVLSLSRLTFTHEMTRLILPEQLYRAFTILRGEKYHK